MRDTHWRWTGVAWVARVGRWSLEVRRLGDYWTASGRRTNHDEAYVAPLSRTATGAKRAVTTAVRRAIAIAEGMAKVRSQPRTTEDDVHWVATSDGGCVAEATPAGARTDPQGVVIGTAEKKRPGT